MKVCRRLLLLPLLLASCAPLFASSCPAYPKGKWKRDKDSALQFEQKWLDVLTAKDTAALDCMLANDFKDTSMKGVLRPKAQVLQELPLRSNQYQQILSHMEADLFDDTAVVRGLNTVSDHQGRQVVRIRFTDVLYYTHGHWFAVSAQETAEAPPH